MCFCHADCEGGREGGREETVRFLLQLTNHEGETRRHAQTEGQGGMLKANGITDVIATG